MNQLNFAAQNRNSGASGQHAGESPQKRHGSMISNGSLEYQPGELPEDFHKRVVDLEIQVEMHGVSQNDNEGHIRMLSDLM